MPLYLYQASLRASHRSAAVKFVQPPRLRRREEQDRALAAFAIAALAGMLIRRESVPPGPRSISQRPCRP